MKRARGAQSIGSKLPVGPAYPGMVPPGLDQGPCTIVFGHNAEAQRVLMQFSVSTSSLIFTIDDARDVAKKLNHYADMAEGKKTQ